MELPFERSLYFFNKEQEKRKRILFSGGRRYGNPLAVLKQFTPPDLWEEFVREYNKQREEDLKSMQSRQNAKMWVEEFPASQTPSEVE